MVRISILLVYGSTYKTSLKVLLAKLLRIIKMQIKIFLIQQRENRSRNIEILSAETFLVYTCVSGPQKIIRNGSS